MLANFWHAAPGWRSRKRRTALFTSAYWLSSHEVVESSLRRVALCGHHLKNGLAIADLFLHGKDRALGGGFLDDRRDGHFGHRQQRVVLRRTGDMFEVGRHLLLVCA